MKSILIQGVQVKTTITIDDALYQKALELAGPNIDKENIVQEALKTFVVEGIVLICDVAVEDVRALAAKF